MVREEEGDGVTKAFYIGMFVSGKGRVFSSKKKMTKEKFPFYVSVIGPFKSDDAAKEFAKRRSLRVGRKAS